MKLIYIHYILIINIYPLYCVTSNLLKLNSENSKYLKNKVECGGISLNAIKRFLLSKTFI
jgi:hypothetical protein